MRKLSLVVVVYGGWRVYKTFFFKTSRIFFKTQRPMKRDIEKIVRVEGVLEVSGTSRIGSLISAR